MVEVERDVAHLRRTPSLDARVWLLSLRCDLCGGHAVPAAHVKPHLKCLRAVLAQGHFIFVVIGRLLAHIAAEVSTNLVARSSTLRNHVPILTQPVPTASAAKRT